MASNRSIRSSTGGWVLNRLMMPPPVSGLMMNMCAVAGDACMGNCFDQPEIFPSALASASGFPQNRAPVSSARYSRDRETAIWMSIAPMGATIAIASMPSPPPPPSRSSRLPPKIAANFAMLASIMIAPARVAATRLDEDVPVLHMRHFVSQHPLELLLGKDPQDPFRDGHGGVLRVADRWRTRWGTPAP